jgi:hypothetical protein
MRQSLLLVLASRPAFAAVVASMIRIRRPRLACGAAAASASPTKAPANRRTGASAEAARHWKDRQARSPPPTQGLERSARCAKAFSRPRAIASAVDLLRLILAYCLGGRGFRSTGRQRHPNPGSQVIRESSHAGITPHSLAFLAPDIVQAAVDGTLPRGLGLSRLLDMPASWVHQRSTIGIARSP